MRKRYVSRYVSCLQADPERTTIDDDKEIQEIDRELEAEVILQWRMLAHNFVEQTSGNDILRKRKPAPKGWSFFGWGAQSGERNHESETKSLSEAEWQQIKSNSIQTPPINTKANQIQEIPSGFSIRKD